MRWIWGFAESLQQECSKPAQNVMIELSPIVLATTLPNKEGSWVFKVLLQRFCKTLYWRLHNVCNRTEKLTAFYNLQVGCQNKEH